MTRPSTPDEPPRLAVPVGPSVETWRAMTPAARDAFLDEVNAALSDPRDAMSEGRPHKKAKTRAIDLLGLHFKAMGRSIYLAEELAVVYPGQVSFSPDVMAVVDVPQPDDDERLAWVVADEGRGLDLVLEVLHHGDREKDLVRNVERYASLGIPEYFVYDRAQQRIHGYRLSTPAALRYQRIVPQAGRYRSAVLGLDLAVQEGTLRFFQGMSELFGTDDLIGRLNGMVNSLEAKADAEAARAEQESARAEQESARARGAVGGLRAGVLAAFEARQVACSDALKRRIEGCDDPAVLQRWLLRALAATSADDSID